MANKGEEQEESTEPRVALIPVPDQTTEVITHGTRTETGIFMQTGLVEESVETQAGLAESLLQGKLYNTTRYSTALPFFPPSCPRVFSFVTFALTY